MSESTLNVVIAIDGPAGAGKSTLAKLLAARLGIRYLDTGAMYRCLGLLAIRSGLSPLDEVAMVSTLKSAVIDFGGGVPPTVFLNGEDVSSGIRTPEVAQAASTVSTLGEVRREMVRQQQSIVGRGGVVLEGRDATTVIAPNATLKVYLTASLEERARRRAVEFGQAPDSHGAEFETVRKDIESRDHRDITREESPLRVADDAHLIESGGVSPDEIADKILALLPSGP